MSDNAKLIAEARAIPMPFEEPEELVLLDELADALEAADNQLRDLSNLIWDYDEWEALARNGNEPAVAVYKLHQVMTEPHA